jgi:hypothetical protein
MPSNESVQSMNFVKDRIGSIGSDILKRFTVIFDYKNSNFYIKKQARKRPFQIQHEWIRHKT